MKDLRKPDKAVERGDGVDLSAIDWDEKVKQIISTDTMLNMHFNDF